MEGWIKLHRRIIDNEIWTQETFNRAQAWVDLLLLANHKDSKILIRGIEITLKRGQLGWSILSLSKRWRWSEGKVKRYLKSLKVKEQIEEQNGELTTIITICNYNIFQTNQIETESKTESKTENRRRTDGEQTETDKNDKKEKKEKIRSKHPKLIPHEDADFILFWKHYPRKVNKKKSAIAFAKLSTHDREQALALVTRYDFNSDLQFVAYPTTWLNSEPWLDDEQNVKNQKFTVDAEGNKTAISDTEAELLERGRNNKPLTM